MEMDLEFYRAILFSDQVLLDFTLGTIIEYQPAETKTVHQLA
jgi:hypothetical protein